MESCQSSRGAATWILILAIATVPVVAANGGVSVCSYLCTCTNQSFVSVDCNFSYRMKGPEPGPPNMFVLDGKHHLPIGATSLNIIIDEGHLALHKDFFRQNTVNHLSIDGHKSYPGFAPASVEFHEGALCNNRGQFPEILVTKVSRLVLNRNISCGAHLLKITNVREVLLKTEFLSVEEAEISIRNVNDLQIEANAFGGSTLSKVQIYHTRIHTLPKLGVSFRLLSFNDCKINEIESYAFAANEVEYMEFVDCKLTTLRQKAVTERLLGDSLIFRGCHIQSIERQFVDGSGLKNLVLDRNTIDEIAPGAFTFTNIYTIVTGNHIIRTGKDWLRPRDWTNVTISGNSFGEFSDIQLNESAATNTYCYFGNNTITNAPRNSFTFGHRCQINAIHFGRECDCTYDSWLTELWGGALDKPLPSAITSTVSCQVEESLRYCFNRSDAPLSDPTAIGQVNVQYFLTEFCQKGGSKRCSSYAAGIVTDTNNKPPPLIPLDRIDSLDDDSEDGFVASNIVLISIVSILLVVCLITLAAYICRRRSNEGRETMTTPSGRQGTLRSTSFNRGTSTFTPNDKRVITNALKWIRESYDQKVWSEIDVPMQQLLEPYGGIVQEQEKVRLIGSIIESVDRHNIRGDHIVALNDILYRHLGPPAPEFVAVSRPNSDRHDELGHIYDELQLIRTHTTFGGPATNVGLLGDYAAPLDHGATVTVVPEGIYSEPVLHDQHLLRTGGNRNFISPYAIGDATVPRNPSGVEGNLPDVIVMRPTRSSWKPDHEDDNEEDDEDEVDGEPERKTMLRPAEEDDDGGTSSPTYAISMKQRKQPQRGNTPTPPLPPDAGDEQSDGTDGSRSEHSGSSMQTVRIEDVALADAGSGQGPKFDETKQ